jgi:hypothetical protein
MGEGIWVLWFASFPKTSSFPNLQLAEKIIFLRLLKNAQMQGARNPEE